MPWPFRAQDQHNPQIPGVMAVTWNPESERALTRARASFDCLCFYQKLTTFKISCMGRDDVIYRVNRKKQMRSKGVTPENGKEHEDVI